MIDRSNKCKKEDNRHNVYTTNNNCPPSAFRPSSPKEAKDGPHDDGVADGVQIEIRRSDSNAGRRADLVKSYRATRRLLLRAVRRGSRSESEVNEPSSQRDLQMCKGR